jgi:hypothetical protein
MIRKFSNLGASVEMHAPESPVSFGKHPQEKTLFSPIFGSAEQWPLQIIVAGVTVWNEGDFWHREIGRAHV